MIPLAIPNLSGNEARYLEECVRTNFVSSVGPFVDDFESMLVDATGATRAVATSSGTAALHAALVAVGVARDDLVVLPSFTFIASANAIAHCGAQPWLLDVDPDSWNLDPRVLDQALSEETEASSQGLRHRATARRVAAILPVYALGLPADMDALAAIARTRGLPVVADAAAAIGCRYRGRELGELDADLSVLSFNGNKTITAGGGGAVVTRDNALAARVQHLTTTARRGADYEHDEVGFNYRMTNLQAAVGCAQLEQLEDFVAAKRRIAATYDGALADLSEIRPFPKPEGCEGSCWLSGVVIAGRSAADLVPHLHALGVGARAFWRPIALQRPYRECPRRPTPVTDAIWASILTLPCSTSLTEAEQHTVIEAVRGCLGARAEPAGTGPGPALWRPAS